MASDEVKSNASILLDLCKKWRVKIEMGEGNCWLIYSRVACFKATDEAIEYIQRNFEEDEY